MTVLYLDGVQVYPDSSQSIKLTWENPYFTEAETYTLDVVLPMDIVENRQFFGNVQRLERSKRLPKMECRLLVDNRVVLVGTARATQVTQQEVKVQLLGGRSEVNFLSADSGLYIDELDLGEVSDGAVASGIRTARSPVYEETQGRLSDCWHFCLVDVVRAVVASCGFTVGGMGVDREPWNRVYVVSATAATKVASVLPHWTVKELVTEFCRFFNLTTVVDQSARTVSFVENPSYFSGREPVALEPVDEYTAELSEDNAEGAPLAAVNLRFSLSSSAAHDYDCLADDVRQALPRQQYATRNEALAAWESMGYGGKRGRVLECPDGRFTGWEHDYSDVGYEEPVLQFTQIDVLRPLMRYTGFGNDQYTELKICPVAIRDEEIVLLLGMFGSSGTVEYDYWLHAPSMEAQSAGGYQSTPQGNFGGSGDGGDEETASVQDYVTGAASISSDEKADRLEVMFIDDVAQTYFWTVNGNRRLVEDSTVTGFTDWQLKKSHKGENHRRWSLSLNPTAADHYLGELHENGFTFDMKARHCFQFLAEGLPDPTRVYIIRGKRYGCEKIEARVDDGRMGRLMTGYFYEML